MTQESNNSNAKQTNFNIRPDTQTWKPNNTNLFLNNKFKELILCKLTL